MMNELDTFKDDMAMKLFGRSKVLAVAGGQCVKCGFPHNLRSDFRDALSHKEYGISGLCQTCQDDIFGEPEEPEVGQGSHAIPGFFIPPEELD